MSPARTVNAARKSACATRFPPATRGSNSREAQRLAAIRAAR
jgi:hypothetical protein